MQLDIGHAVTYPFEDKRWPTKLIVFLILGFIPGLNIIVWSGYAISIARNMIRGEQYPLPSWENWSDIAVRGLLAIAATLLYFSPALLITCCLLVASWVLGERGQGLLLTLRCFGYGLAILYVLTINYVLGSGHLRYAETDQFFAYLDIGGRFRDLRDMPGLFGMLFLYEGLLSFLLLLLMVVAVALSLFALSLIATLGSFFGIIIAVLLAIALAGFLAIVTMAFLSNGYILGVAGITRRSSARR